MKKAKIEEKPLTLLLLERRALYRESLLKILMKVPIQLLPPPIKSYTECLESIKKYHPEVLLFSVSSTDIIETKELLVKIKTTYPKVRILLMPSVFFHDSEKFFDLLIASDGYIPLGWLSEQFVKALSYLREGEYLFPRETTDWIIKKIKERRETGRLPFTPKEREIFKLLVQGKTNKEIATAPSTSEKTVKNQLVTLYLKLGATNRSQAVAEILRLKID